MRNKSGRIAVALLLAITMIGSGCSTNWAQQAQEILVVLMPATTNLVILVATAQGKEMPAEDLAVIQNAGTEVGGDLKLIQSLIRAYESADAEARPGILNQIQSGIHAAQENLQGLMLGLHIKDAATQAKVTAIVGILLSEVQSLAVLVPLVQGQGAGAREQGAGAREQKAAAREQGAAAARVAMRGKNPLSASEFVKSYNATMTAKTGRAELDRVTGKLQIQLHSKVERAVSGGVLR